MPFEFKTTEIPGVVIISSKKFQDSRGYFDELYKKSVFAEAGYADVVQVNHSRSVKSVVRGLHYQLEPYSQSKLVSVISGKIFDVAVDVREGSVTYGKWVGVELSDDNGQMLLIPEGFAHGFCVLSEIADVIYYCNREYDAGSERGIIWNDPVINIKWPVDIPVISEKDAVLPGLNEADNNFRH